MRNLKKILALALVFAMAFTFTAGAADFTDKADIGTKYVDDVNVLVELGVIAGYPDGSFGPQKNITRAEFAKMAYTLKYGSDTNGDLFAAQKSTFTDVEGNANVAWAKGYINYCANQKIVSGVGNNKFNPQGNITVAEATKMILVILGCDPAKEGFTGANWAANVTAKAIDLGVFAGWTGDPTSLATRELVAKLMRNAIFSPVYTYSAITGAGSQLNALGNAYNETLGEKTMGLEFLTGIVVANENYFIDKDAEGESIGVSATTLEDEAQIYYTYRDEQGTDHPRFLTVPVALGDEMLGNEVSVLFKADSTNDNWYENVELIGDVMVTSDTVVYEVPSIAVDMYPDGDSTSESLATPYIGFIVDGVEKQIKASSAAGKVAKNLDAQTDASAAAARAEFANIAWVSNETSSGTALTLTSDPQDGAAFFADMGMPTLSNYRFISVDGGKTYSYIFKMVADTTNANYADVTNYSEAKGAITISNLGRVDLEEANIIGDVATDDKVVYYRENGVLNIAKVEAVTGSVEAINDNGSVVINGETYFLWLGAVAELGANTLADYYTTTPSAMGEATTYYTYGNLVLDLEVAEATAVVSDYAVILRSTYDEGLDTAYVTLAFADDTEATYEIGKLHVENRSNPFADENDLASDFDMNGYFGMLVKYKVMDNGKVDLSGNDFGKIAGNRQTPALNSTYPGSTTEYYSTRFTTAPAAATAFEGELDVDGTKYYALNDATTLFVLYGNPQYNAQGGINRQSGYAPVKAKAYKLVDKALQNMAAIDDLYLYNNLYNACTVSLAVNTNRGISKGLVAAAMTIGVQANDSGDAADGEALGYVVAASRKYNVESQEYYLQMTIIGDDGLFTAKTVDSCPDFQNIDHNLSGNLGKLLAGDQFGPKSFVEYVVNAEGVITNIADAIYTNDFANTVAFTQGVADEGLYLVNAVSERNDKLFFIDANVAITDNADAVKNQSQSSVKFAEDGYEKITIDGDEYVGETIIKIAASTDTLEVDKGNAVIQVNDEGEIIRVFSFIEGYTK